MTYVDLAALALIHATAGAVVGYRLVRWRLRVRRMRAAKARQVADAIEGGGWTLPLPAPRRPNRLAARLRERAAVEAEAFRCN
jgi:hypothetical protein